MRSLSRKKSALAELLTDDWLLNWSYLADIFSSLNELNLKLQGRHDNVFLNWKNVQAFQKSLKLWLARLRRPDPSHYMRPTVLQHVEEHDVAATQVKHLSALIQTHLAALIENFDRYFQRVMSFWMIKGGSKIPSNLRVLSLCLSWPSVLQKKPSCSSSSAIALCKDAMDLCPYHSGYAFRQNILSSVGPVYLCIFLSLLHICALWFSVLTKMKTKYRNRLNAAPGMRCALSCTPDWNALEKRRQAKPH